MSPGYPRKKRKEPKAELSDEESEEHNCRFLDSFDLGIDRNGADRGPGQHKGNNDGIGRVRPPAHAMVAEHSAEDELDIKNKDRKQGQGKETGAATIKLNSRGFFHPSLSSEYSDDHGNRKEGLRDGGVCSRNRRGLKEQHSQTTEDCLHNNRTKRAHRQPTQPAATLNQKSPHCNSKREGDE